MEEIMNKQDKPYITKEIMAMSQPEKMLYFGANGTIFDPIINGLYLK